MDIFSCIAPGFQDPDPDPLSVQIKGMLDRIEQEELHRSLNATDYEKNEKHLRRFLTKHFRDLEVALNQWHGWVEWRHSMQVDIITEADVAEELKEGIIAWRGRNKAGMLCCVITGRLMDPLHRTGSHSSFKKYILKSVEDGLKQADETEQDKICIIYDRRGLDFQHIDPNLEMFCKKTIEEIRDWYSDRLGAIYVVHTNLFFWLLYMIVIRPILSLWAPNQNLVVVEKPEELLQYFDEDQLFLLKVDGSNTDEVKVSIEANSQSEEKSSISSPQQQEIESKTVEREFITDRS